MTKPLPTDAPAPEVAARMRAWDTNHKAIEEYVEGYEFRGPVP